MKFRSGGKVPAQSWKLLTTYGMILSLLMPTVAMADAGWVYNKKSSDDSESSDKIADYFSNKKRITSAIKAAEEEVATKTESLEQLQLQVTNLRNDVTCDACEIDCEQELNSDEKAASRVEKIERTNRNLPSCIAFIEARVKFTSISPGCKKAIDDSKHECPYYDKKNEIDALILRIDARNKEIARLSDQLEGLKDECKNCDELAARERVIKAMQPPAPDTWDKILATVNTVTPAYGMTLDYLAYTQGLKQYGHYLGKTLDSRNKIGIPSNYPLPYGAFGTGYGQFGVGGFGQGGFYGQGGIYGPGGYFPGGGGCFGGGGGGYIVGGGGGCFPGGGGGGGYIVGGGGCGGVFPAPVPYPAPIYGGGGGCFGGGGGIYGGGGAIVGGYPSYPGYVGSPGYAGFAGAGMGVVGGGVVGGMYPGMMAGGLYSAGMGMYNPQYGALGYAATTASYLDAARAQQKMWDIRMAQSQVFQANSALQSTIGGAFYPAPGLGYMGGGIPPYGGGYPRGGSGSVF